MYRSLNSKMCHFLKIFEALLWPNGLIFQVFSSVLMRLCPLESKNTFVLVLAIFMDFWKFYVFGPRSNFSVILLYIQCSFNQWLGILKTEWILCLVSHNFTNMAREAYLVSFSFAFALFFPSPFKSQTSKTHWSAWEPGFKTTRGEYLSKSPTIQSLYQALDLGLKTTRGDYLSSE